MFKPPFLGTPSVPLTLALPWVLPSVLSAVLSVALSVVVLVALLSGGVMAKLR